MPDAPVLSREVNYATTIVLVDGIARTGKSLFGPILASFTRVEIERVEPIHEHIAVLHKMGKIKHDAAVTLLRLRADDQLYNGMIGRNVNFRFWDHSSVWKNPNRFRYLKRLFGPEQSHAAQRIAEECPIFQNQTHDQLANFELFHDAFADRLRIVESIRHPVDLVDSWMRRGWGDRFGTDPLALTLCIRHEGQELPYYALGWESLYLEATPLSRVVRMIEGLWDDGQVVYKSLSEDQQNQVFVIPLEDFVQKPSRYLGPLAAFLGSNTTRHTPSALKRQNCPRTYSVEVRQEKQKRFESELPAEEREILGRLIEEYELMAASVAAAVEQRGISGWAPQH